MQLNFIFVFKTSHCKSPQPISNTANKKQLLPNDGKHLDSGKKSQRLLKYRIKTVFMLHFQRHDEIVQNFTAPLDGEFERVAWSKVKLSYI